MSTLNLLDLPIYVLYNIFQNLNSMDFRNVMLTCKKLNQLITEDTILWKTYGSRKLLIEKSRNCSKNEFNWYNKCRLSHNWCNGIYRDKIVLQHKVDYMPWLRLWDQYLLLSVGSELRCYPTTDRGLPLCKKYNWKINVHNNNGNSKLHDISRFKIRGKHIVCGNRDGSLNVYKFKNTKSKPNQRYQIFDCHDQGNLEVSAVELIEGDPLTVISSSFRDPCVKIWQSDDCDEYHDLLCAKEIPLSECTGAKCLCLNTKQDKLAVGLDGNKTSIIIDIETGKIDGKKDQKDTFQVIRDVQWHNENTIVYTTHSGQAHCMDIRTLQIVRTVLDPFCCSIYCVRTDNNNAIVTGAAEYSRCVLFDFRKETIHKQMYFTQKKCSPVYSLDFDATKLVAAADRSVAAIDFNIAIQNVQIRNYYHIFHVV